MTLLEPLLDNIYFEEMNAMFFTNYCRPWISQKISENILMSFIPEYANNNRTVVKFQKK